MSYTADGYSGHDSAETNPEFCVVDGAKNQEGFWPPLSARSFAPPNEDSYRDKLRDKLHARLGLPSSFTIETDSTEILFANLLNDSWEIRVRALRTIARDEKQEPDRVKRAFIRALEDESEYVRAAAAQALAPFQDQALIPLLLQVIKDTCWQVRTAALQTLGKWGLVEITEHFRQALGDKEPAVQMAALYALNNNGMLSLRQDLLPAFDSEDARVRLTALQLLRVFRDALTSQELQSILLDTDEEIRAEALRVFGQSAVVVPMELLLTIFNDQQEKVRVRLKALHLIRERQEPLPVESLLRALKDPNQQIQSEVSKLLAKRDSEIPWQASSSFLLQLLQDEIADLRAVAAWALGEKRVLGARQALLQACSDPDLQVRKAASRALDLLGDLLVNTESRLLTSSLLALRAGQEEIGVRFLTSLADYLRDKYGEVQRNILPTPSGPVLTLSCRFRSRRGHLEDTVLCTLKEESTDIHSLEKALQSQDETIRLVAAEESKYLEGKAWEELFITSFELFSDDRVPMSANIPVKIVLCTIGLVPSAGRTKRMPVLKKVLEAFQEATICEYSYQVCSQRDFAARETEPSLISPSHVPQSRISVKPNPYWMGRTLRSIQAWYSSSSRHLQQFAKSLNPR